MNQDSFWVATTTKHNKSWFEELLRLNPDVNLGVDGYVYYALLDNAKVKIGYVHEAERLLPRLRFEMPEQYPFHVVDLLAIEPGGFLREQFRHYQFSDLRVPELGEQFHSSSELWTWVHHLREVALPETANLFAKVHANFGKKYRRGGAVLGASYAVLKHPDGPDWFFSDQFAEFWAVLDKLKACGYVEMDDGLRFVLVKNSSQGAGRLDMIIRDLVARGATKV